VLFLIKLYNLNMKSKAILVSFVALFALAFALSTVVASFVDTSTMSVEINGIDTPVHNIGNAIAVEASETVPVVVRFTALTDQEDVRIKVYVEGFKNEIEDETSRFHVKAGNTYVKRFTLTMPSTEDFDDAELFELLDLLVRFSAKGEVSEEFDLPLEVQKELHSLSLLSIDMTEVVVSGDRIAIDVVVENNGFDRLDNVYVKASIPGLAVSSKVYAGDLESVQDNFDDDINDAVVKRIYLNVPRNAVPGNYEIEVEAFNHDTSVTAVGRVLIENVQSNVLSSGTSRTISPGQETSFDLVLVNPGNRMMVYTIMPEETKGVLVDVSESIVAVGADSSRTVKVRVRATDNAQEGTYVVTLNANTDSGVTKQVSYTVSVEEPSRVTGSTVVGQTNNVVVLTVVLVIIFVVLLIILIVLLSRRPIDSEELGETNYY